MAQDVGAQFVNSLAALGACPWMHRLLFPAWDALKRLHKPDTTWCMSPVYPSTFQGRSQKQFIHSDVSRYVCRYVCI